jgi:hypothetical protein
MSTRHKPALLFASFVVLAVLSVIVAGCGQSKSAATTGQTVGQTPGQTTADVVTTQGSDTVSVSAGDASWTFGEGVSIPEGFPKALLPAGAKVVSAVSTGEAGAGAMLIAFESALQPKKMYQTFVDSLGGAGYKIANKVLIDGGDERSTLAIEANGPAGKVVVAGGGKTGDTYAYTIMVQ